MPHIDELNGRLRAAENAPGGAAAWGSISGTLGDQNDLNTALGLKANTADLGTAAAADVGDFAAAGHTHTGVYEPADGTILKDADIGVTVAAQPTGTPDGTKYLRDDNTWQAVPGGSGLTQPQVMARCLGC